MSKQFAVIGLGRFGSEVARILSKNKYSVIAIDRNEAKVREIADVAAVAVRLDATDEKALREAGVQNVDVAIVSIGEHIESSILVVMILKDLGIKNIVAKAISDLHGRILSQLGVNRVVHPERDMAQKIALTFVKPHVLELIELSKDYSIVEFPAPVFLQNKTIMESNLRSEYGLTIIAIKPHEPGLKEEQLWNINPYPSDSIKEGDILVLLGKNDDIQKFSKMTG